MRNVEPDRDATFQDSMMLNNSIVHRPWCEISERTSDAAHVLALRALTVPQ